MQNPTARKRWEFFRQHLVLRAGSKWKPVEMRVDAIKKKTEPRKPRLDFMVRPLQRRCEENAYTSIIQEKLD
ncbi:hypothetical protein T10_1614 [Trichinella papuae]|uniref:Uncharacterized protein n=1 Tax=Trichinella papuae TaxID=268474 RepID=A0A0V1N0Z5_9BILA|nr:hypothetical protein T10_1614 [Trichinella papuae]